MAARRPTDIFDVGPPPKEPIDRSADVPADAWQPVRPTTSGLPSTFDEAADDIQRRASLNAANYLFELEQIAVAWRDDVTLSSTSLKAAVHLLSLAAGAPEKRNKPAPKLSRRVDELRALLTDDDEGDE